MLREAGADDADMLVGGGNIGAGLARRLEKDYSVKPVSYTHLGETNPPPDGGGAGRSALFSKQLCEMEKRLSGSGDPHPALIIFLPVSYTHLSRQWTFP